MEAIVNNWEAITAGILVLLASIDKIVILTINSLGNMRDAWRTTFPNDLFDE